MFAEPGYAQPEASLVWKSYEHHKALTSRINYSEILGLKDSHKIYRLELNNDPLPALLAPITEVSTLILKPGKTKPELDAIVTADLPFTSEPGCFGPISWGATLEFSNTIFMLFGWESTKVRRPGWHIFALLILFAETL